MGRGDRVGLLLDKSLEALVGIYGVLEAGAAYVPLDIQSPAARLAYIAGNAGLRVLITSDHKAGSCGELLREGPLETLVSLDSEAPDAPAELSVVSAPALAGYPAPSNRAPAAVPRATSPTSATRQDRPAIPRAWRSHT